MNASGSGFPEIQKQAQYNVYFFEAEKKRIYVHSRALNCAAATLAFSSSFPFL